MLSNCSFKNKTNRIGGKKEESKMKANTTGEMTKGDPEKRLVRAIFGPDYHSFKEAIKEVLSRLTELDKEVLTLKCGLETGKPLSAKEAGERLGLSYQKVTAIERSALKKMRTSKIETSIRKLVFDAP